MDNRKFKPFNEKTSGEQYNKNNQDVEKDNRTIFSEIKNLFKYMFQSAQGKYSLETYLEVLNEFTDPEIISSEENGLEYIGGEVIFLTSKIQSDILITIKLEFQDDNGDWKLKKAERRVEKSMFTQETINRLNNNQETKFEIEKPNK